jgi:hypothetical protein
LSQLTNKAPLGPTILNSTITASMVDINVKVNEGEESKTNVESSVATAVSTSSTMPAVSPFNMHTMPPIPPTMFPGPPMHFPPGSMFPPQPPLMGSTVPPPYPPQSFNSSGFIPNPTMFPPPPFPHSLPPQPIKNEININSEHIDNMQTQQQQQIGRRGRGNSPDCRDDERQRKRGRSGSNSRHQRGDSRDRQKR